MNKVDPETKILITSMKKSVAKALDRKRRLGQYAVIWKDGKVVHLQPDEIGNLAVAEDSNSYNIR